MTAAGEASYEELLARAAPYLLPAAAAAVADAGYGRVAVAGDAWLRGRAAQFLRDGLPDLPLDADGMVDALVLALEELDAEAAAVESGELRAWDPGKHPRGPGGRFRSTVDVLKEAIQAHRRGGGKGDPFDGYSREQLRRVARARGIDLKRGEDRDSISRKLLDHLGGPQTSSSTPRKPRTPTATAPPARSTRNPPVLTGDGDQWWELLPDDTGFDQPVPVRRLELDDYTLRSGRAYRVDGITVLVEDGSGPASDQVARGFLDHHKRLPPEASRYEQGYAWLAGPNPADSYWETKYNMPGFRSFANAGDGGVRVWGRANTSLGPSGYQAELMHEFGHNVSSSAAQKGLDDRGPAWAQAGVDDAGVTRPTDITWTGPLLGKLQKIRFDYQTGKGYPRGVTEYGKSSPGEDYAESMAFYLGGQIGKGRLQPGGPEVPIYFRDLFPGRAAVLDRVFPEIARRQQAAVSGR